MRETSAVPSSVSLILYISSVFSTLSLILDTLSNSILLLTLTHYMLFFILCIDTLKLWYSELLNPIPDPWYSLSIFKSIPDPWYTLYIFKSILDPLYNLRYSQPYSWSLKLWVTQPYSWLWSLIYSIYSKKLSFCLKLWFSDVFFVYSTYVSLMYSGYT